MVAVAVVVVVVVVVALFRAWYRWTPMNETRRLEVLPNFLVSCNTIVCI
jgi:hypothetical protein